MGNHKARINIAVVIAFSIGIPFVVLGALYTIRWLRTTSASVASTAAATQEAVKRCISNLNSGDPQVRLEAIRRLGQFEADANSAAQTIVQIAYSDREPPAIRKAAGTALTHIRLSLQIKDLKANPDRDVREFYASRVGRKYVVSQWPDPSAYKAIALPALLWSARNDPDARVRNSAVLGVGSMWEEPEAEEAAGTIVPLLIEAMRDPDRDVRISAVVVLGDYGKHAKAALPILTKMRDDPDEEMRHQVRRGIWCIEQDSKGH